MSFILDDTFLSLVRYIHLSNDLLFVCRFFFHLFCGNWLICFNKFLSHENHHSIKLDFNCDACMIFVVSSKQYCFYCRTHFADFEIQNNDNDNTCLPISVFMCGENFKFFWSLFRNMLLVSGYSGLSMDGLNMDQYALEMCASIDIRTNWNEFIQISLWTPHHHRQWTHRQKWPMLIK